MLYGIFSALPMLTCLFWTLSLLFDFRRNDRAKRFLTLFMGTATVLYFCHCVYFNKMYALLPITESIYALVTLSVYPLYFLYIKLLSEPRKLNIRDFHILIPAVLSCALSIVIYAMMECEERAEYMEHTAFGEVEAGGMSPLVLAQRLHCKLIGTVLALQIIHILWAGGRKIVRYNRAIKNYYSNTEGKTFSEVRSLLLFFVITSLASFVVNLIGKHHFTEQTWMVLIPSLLFSVLLYAIGYIGNRQNFTAMDFSREVWRSDSLETAGKEPPGRLTQLARELIESRELYLQPDIKVSDIAGLLNTNRTYLSVAINRDLNISFSTLINTYRIEYAKRLITENSDLHRTDVAERSGFTSEASFYRTFKAVTGTTPRRWFSERCAE